MTSLEFTKLILSNAKTNKWLSGYFEVTHLGKTFTVGVKSFGLWVQRLECNGQITNVPEQRTQKRLKELLEIEYNYLFV